MAFSVLQVQAQSPGSEMDLSSQVPSPDPAILVGGPQADVPSPPFGPAILPVDDAWVTSTLAGMTLEQKVGQMIMPFYSNLTQAQNDITNYGVTGFIFSTNTTVTVLNSGNTLQGVSPLPLLFSVDCETGLGARITGATRFPHNMALGSTLRTDLATSQGQVTARECRALGIHIGFGPVLDVNTEPVNPVIGIRSYADHTDRITTMARAYVDGARAEGLQVTFKHFPGHGPTDGDSHETLPIVAASLPQIEAIHVQPYRTLIAEGRADLVMSAHVWYQALDPGVNAIPATLSSAAMTGILRTELGFDGVAISDAFNMAGLTAVGTTAQAAVTGVNAGIDLILMPSSTADVYNGIRNGVINGDIAVARIDQAVARILRLKSKAGLDGRIGLPNATTAGATLFHPEHRAAAHSIGLESVRTARVQPGVLPLQPSHQVLVVAPANSSSIFYTETATTLISALQTALPSVTVLTPAASPSGSDISNALAAAASADRIVYVDRDWKPDLVASKDSLISQLIATGKPVIMAGFGSPYRIDNEPNLENFLCAFSSHTGCQTAMAQALLGQVALPPNLDNWPVASTYLPVTVSEFGVE